MLFRKVFIKIAVRIKFYSVVKCQFNHSGSWAYTDLKLNDYTVSRKRFSIHISVVHKTIGKKVNA